MNMAMLGSEYIPPLEGRVVDEDPVITYRTYRSLGIALAGEALAAPAATFPPKARIWQGRADHIRFLRQARK